MMNPPGSSCPMGTVYTIRAGDTLFAIAARMGTTVAAILGANPGIDPNRLFIGQQICIPSAVTPPPPPPSTCVGFIYTIKAGDTLFALAARYNTTVQAILDANPGLDPNRLFIGQEICLPVRTPTCPGFIYTVRAGDTLYALAARYGANVPNIIAHNPGINPNALVVGQRICIPVPVPAGCQGFTYTIQAGDTIYALAARYGLAPEVLLAANPGLDPYRLSIGQQICIPASRP